MTKVLQFNDPGRAEREAREQACLWLVRLEDNAGGKDMEGLQDWLAEHPRNARLLVEAARMWDQSSVLGELSEIFPLDGYGAAGCAPAGKLHGWMSLAAIAASLFVVVLLNNGLTVGFREEAPSPVAASPSFSGRYETLVGEQERISLPDGSHILLNTNSVLRIDYTDTERGIVLARGEGHFEVAKDPARPFRVHAGNGIVEAVGTAFSVQHLQQELTEVTVVEGKVNLTRMPREAAERGEARGPGPAHPGPSPMEILPLVAGEAATLKGETPGIQKRKMQPSEIEGRLAWRHGMLLFQGKPLKEVIEEVSRYTSIRIDLDDSVKDIAVQGYFPAGEIDGLLLTMKETFNVDVKVIGKDHILLSSE